MSIFSAYAETLLSLFYQLIKDFMGCDIHLHFEQKNKEGKWEEIEFDHRLEPDDRYYDVFCFLAGVRGNPEMIEPQFKGRGIPEDSSCEKFFCHDEDIHSCTHAYLDEILKAPWEHAGLDKCDFYIFCEYILPKLCTATGWGLNTEQERNVRVIIGFDN